MKERWKRKWAKANELLREWYAISTRTSFAFRSDKRIAHWVVFRWVEFSWNCSSSTLAVTCKTHKEKVAAPADKKPVKMQMWASLAQERWFSDLSVNQQICLTLIRVSWCCSPIGCVALKMALQSRLVGGGCFFCRFQKNLLCPSVWFQLIASCNLITLDYAFQPIIISDYRFTPGPQGSIQTRSFQWHACDSIGTVSQYLFWQIVIQVLSLNWN